MHSQHVSDSVCKSKGGGGGGGENVPLPLNEALEMSQNKNFVRQAFSCKI